MKSLNKFSIRKYLLKKIDDWLEFHQSKTVMPSEYLPFSDVYYDAASMFANIGDEFRAKKYYTKAMEMGHPLAQIKIDAFAGKILKELTIDDPSFDLAEKAFECVEFKEVFRNAKDCKPESMNWLFCMTSPILNHWDTIVKK